MFTNAGSGFIVIRSPRPASVSSGAEVPRDSALARLRGRLHLIMPRRR